MECELGEEAQVDYEEIRILKNEKGNLVKIYLLRVVLSCDRKSYTEANRRTSCRCIATRRTVNTNPLTQISKNPIKTIPGGGTL